MYHKVCRRLSVLVVVLAAQLAAGKIQIPQVRRTFSNDEARLGSDGGNKRRDTANSRMLQGSGGHQWYKSAPQDMDVFSVEGDNEIGSIRASTREPVSKESESYKQKQKPVAPTTISKEVKGKASKASKSTKRSKSKKSSNKECAPIQTRLVPDFTLSFVLPTTAEHPSDEDIALLVLETTKWFEEAVRSMVPSLIFLIDVESQLDYVDFDSGIPEPKYNVVIVLKFVEYTFYVTNDSSCNVPSASSINSIMMESITPDYLNEVVRKIPGFANVLGVHVDSSLVGSPSPSPSPTPTTASPSPKPTKTVLDDTPAPVRSPTPMPVKPSPRPTISSSPSPSSQPSYSMAPTFSP